MEGNLPHGGYGGVSSAGGDAELERRVAFILANTAPIRPPHVPEIELLLASEAHELWLKTEDELEAIGLPPPFWAFAWAGGQGLARFVLDTPEIVRGRSVLDFATGSGLVAIAAAMAGARSVAAVDIDAYCAAAVVLNAARNGVAIEPVIHDLIGHDGGWEVVLAGDVFYEQPLAERLMPWLSALAGRGATVLVGDPGRAYLPKGALGPHGVLCGAGDARAGGCRGQEDECLADRLTPGPGGRQVAAQLGRWVMSFGGVSYLAILVAAVAAFAFGAAWYMGLSKPWIRAARLNPADIKPTAVPFIISFLALLVMGWVLAGVIGHLGEGQATLRNGLITGLLLWAGFTATTLTVNHRYQGFGWDLTLIDAGHWLGVALIMGGIIGWWG